MLVSSYRSFFVLLPYSFVVCIFFFFLHWGVTSLEGFQNLSSVLMMKNGCVL